jgi:hypothetical protein
MSGPIDRMRKDRNKAELWFEGRTPDGRSAFFRRAARAQWGPKKIPPKKADDGLWTWPIDLERYEPVFALNGS